MGNVNRVILLGRLGKDPEVKALANGQTLARLTIATSETWVKDGQKQEKTDWHTVVVFGKKAETAGKYLKKGQEVYIEGRLKTRSWETEQGDKRYATEVVMDNMQFVGAKKEGSSRREESSNDDYGFQDFGPEPNMDENDEIPF